MPERFSNGFTLLHSFTYARGLDNVGAWNDPNGSLFPEDAYNFANDVMTIYPVHGFFANLFRMRVFRCDTSGLMVALSVALMLAIILAARRANTDDSKAVLRKVDA